MDHLDTIGRILYITCCAASVVILLARALRNWRTYTVRMRDHWWSIFLWSFAGAFGGTEVFLGLDTRIRVAIVDAAAVITLVALLQRSPLVDRSDDRLNGGPDRS